MPASHRSGYALGLLCLACCACDLHPGEHGHLFAGDADADASEASGTGTKKHGSVEKRAGDVGAEP